MPSTNPQVHCDASRRWRQRHPEAVKEQKRRYYLRSRDRLRAVRNARNRARSGALREKVHEKLGSVCVRCGFTDWRALQVEHINGNGRCDRARFTNREQFLREVLLYSQGYQLMCANCNWIKRHEQCEFGPGRPVTVGVTLSTITED